MILDKYNECSVFSLPLIFNGTITNQELLDNGFLNIYLHERENNCLNNHIFLVFRNLKINLRNKLKTYSLYFSEYSKNIDNKRYTIVSVEKTPRIKNILEIITKGFYKGLTYQEKVKIIDYWNIKANDKAHAYLFDDSLETGKPKDLML